MKNITFATIAASGLVAVSLALAAPALANTAVTGSAVSLSAVTGGSGDAGGPTSRGHLEQPFGPANVQVPNVDTTVHQSR
jgi:hypothetical protein